MSEVKDITEYTEVQTSIEGLTMELDNAITPQMKNAIRVHEAIIHHAGEAVTHLYEMGRQLKTMRDDKLYTHLGYESFGQYVENNGDYSFKERQAYKYIKVVESYSSKFIEDNQSLGIERLEMLTALGERDAAELADSEDLAGMTTAEVKQLIKEKQGLGEQLSMLTAELDNSEAEYNTEIEEAKKEIEQLKQKLKTEKDKGKKKQEEHKGEILLLKEQLANAKPTDEQVEEIRSKAISEVKAEYEEKVRLAEDKMSALEKKMQSKNENESRAALKVYFEETQKNVNSFIDKIKVLNDKDERDKYISGAIKWLERIVEQLKVVGG